MKSGGSSETRPRIRNSCHSNLFIAVIRLTWKKLLSSKCVARYLHYNAYSLFLRGDDMDAILAPREKVPLVRWVDEKFIFAFFFLNACSPLTAWEDRAVATEFFRHIANDVGHKSLYSCEKDDSISLCRPLHPWPSSLSMPISILRNSSSQAIDQASPAKYRRGLRFRGSRKLKFDLVGVAGIGGSP